MAWNTFIAGFDYFGSRYGEGVTFYIACAFNYPSLFTLVLSVRYAANFSIGSRLVVVLSVCLAALVLTPLLPLLHLAREAEKWVLLVLVFCTGVATGVNFGTTLGFASMCPSSCVTAAMSGIGAGGVFAGALRILTKVSLPDTTAGTRESIVIFFSLAAAILLGCLVVYTLMRSNAYVQHYIAADVAAKAEEHQPLLADDVREMPGVVAPAGESGRVGPASARVVLSKLWPQALCAFGVFFVTLTLFPGVTASIKPSGKLLGQGWFTVLLIAEFQLGDFLGRALPQLLICLNETSLAYVVVLRLAFFPLFLFSAGISGYQPFRADWIPFAVMGAFSLSNGYAGTLAMIFGPSRVAPHERELAGLIMSLALNAGVTLGVNVALAFA